MTITDRLVNQLLGSLPETVPQVTGLRTLSTTTTDTATLFSVGWTNPERLGIDHYEVFARNIYNSNEQPILLAAVTDSPAVVRLTPDQTTTTVLAVQVVLENGQKSDLATAPTLAPVISPTSVTLTPASIPTEQIVVEGMTLTNNSPSAGKIAWSACTVYYNGTAYAISSGSTGATTNKFVTWTIGAGSFSGVDSYTPAANIFLIASNKVGTADTSWNKMGSKAIQEDHLSFSLVYGYQPQPLGTLSATIPPTPGQQNNYTLVNVSEKGIFWNLNLYVVAVGSGATPRNRVEFQVKITIDGSSSPTTYTVWTSLLSTGLLSFQPAALAMATDHQSDGSIPTSFANIAVNQPYNTSFKVEVFALHINDGNVGGAYGGSWDVPPTLRCDILRSVKV